MDQGAGFAKGPINHGFYKSVTDECVRYAERWVYWETHTHWEKQKGSGEYHTKRSYYEASGKGDRIDDYAVSWRGKLYVDVFWELRRFYGNDIPVTPRMLADYCADSGVLLDRHDRDIIYQMDSAFRSALGARRAENDKSIADRK